MFLFARFSLLVSLNLLAFSLLTSAIDSACCFMLVFAFLILTCLSPLASHFLRFSSFAVLPELVEVERAWLPLAPDGSASAEHWKMASSLVVCSWSSWTRDVSGCSSAGHPVAAENRSRHRSLSLECSFRSCAPGARGRGMCLAAQAPGILWLQRTGRDTGRFRSSAPFGRVLMDAGCVWLLSSAGHPVAAENRSRQRLLSLECSFLNVVCSRSSLTLDMPGCSCAQVSCVSREPVEKRLEGKHSVGSLLALLLLTSAGIARLYAFPSDSRTGSFWRSRMITAEAVIT